MTAKDKDDRILAATVNWVTHTSFKPPLVAVGVKTNSQIHDIFKTTRNFALNVLGKGQRGAAYAFFKTAERDGQKISGEPFRAGITGAPILEDTPDLVECRLLTTVEESDHSIFMRKVVVSEVTQEPEGLADKATLLQKDLGEKKFLRRMIRTII